MQLSVLGPVRIVDDAGVELEARPQLRRLAALLVVAGQAGMTADQIAEHLTTASDGSAIRTAVSRLRSMLGTRVESAGGGYRLSLAVDELDASLFERNCAAAREADLSARVELLSGALAHWRGDALDEFAHEEWARPTAVRWDEARAEAIENLAAALIESGRSPEAITLLGAHLERHPYRERPVALQMQALAASGRVTDALRVFQRFQVVLREEVGIEPTEALKQLELGLLSNDEPIDGAVPYQVAAPTLDRIVSVPMRGVVSILFTDIVGSTRMWSDHEAAMAVALARHDSLLLEVIAGHDGQAFKHTGDGMAAVFADPERAVAAAIAVQRSIESERWGVPGGIHVRAAVHSGGVHERDGDLFGPTLNRAARLLGLCPSGAVLVSEATAGLVGPNVIEGCVLDECGRVQLRDFARTELVHALVGDGIAAVPVFSGTDRSAGAQQGILPVFDDELVGRDDEIRLLVDALGTARLVSIVGTGGIGKTRLAAVVARAAASRFVDGVWWCDLTNAATPAAVPAVVLRDLAARPRQGRTPIECVTDHLGDRSALIVLDNCEHVVDAARELVAAIRAACPEVRILCTSREGLGVRGEHLKLLRALDGAAARELFVSRATAVRPGLEWSDMNREAAARLCHDLDGVPLAIELAAARCRSMSPVEIALRLGNRLDLLKGGVERAERHRTLEAAVDWSYSMLDPVEQVVFDKMSVFVGGASLEAIVAVTGLVELDTVDVLDHLIARSMLVVIDTPLGTRYRQLETLRQFGAARLAARGATSEAVAAHLGWATGLAARFKDDFLTSDEVYVLRQYSAEFDNLRAAVANAVASGRIAEAVEVVSGLLWWAMYRPSYELLDWIPEHDLIGRCGEPAVASVTGMMAELALLAGDNARADRLAEAAEAGDPGNPAAAVARTGLAVWVDGDLQRAREVLNEARVDSPAASFFTRIYDTHRVTFEWMIDPTSIDDRANVAVAAGRALVDERRAAGSNVTLAHSLAVLGYLHLALSDFDRALLCSSEAADLAQDAEAWFAVDAAEICLASALGQVQVRRPDQRTAAARQLRDVLARTADRRNWFFVGMLLASAAPVTLWSLGDQRTALLARHVGARFYPSWRDLLPRKGVAQIDPDERALIETDASLIDLVGATALVLDAIDGALERPARTDD